MTLTNLGLNSATTKDWLQAIKNQSSPSVQPSHSSGLGWIFTKERSERKAKPTNKRQHSRSGSKKK